jgi:hypothetical protein
MKDNAPSALMVFFMVIVVLILLNDLTTADVQEESPVMVHQDLSDKADADLATTDAIE